MVMWCIMLRDWGEACNYGAEYIVSWRVGKEHSLAKEASCWPEGGWRCRQVEQSPCLNLLRPGHRQRLGGPASPLTEGFSLLIGSTKLHL